MNIEDYVKSYIEDYKKFMGIKEFPYFTVKSKEIILEKSLAQGLMLRQQCVTIFPLGAILLKYGQN